MLSAAPSSTFPIPYLPINLTSYIILASAFLLVVVTRYYASVHHPKLFAGFETIGLEKGTVSFSEAKKRFVAQGKELVWAGIQKCQGPFQVVAPSGPIIIFPSRYVTELKKHDKSLSFEGNIEREFFPNVPGFEGVRESVRSRVIQDSVRINLTQSLNLVTQDLCEETVLALHHLFGESREWTSCYFQRMCPELVARLSTRVFLGPVLAHDQDWLHIAVDYTIQLMTAARALRLWPSLLQPLVHRFLPECRALQAQTRNARHIIDQEVERRRVKWEEDMKNGKRVSKTGDTLGWMQELSQGKPFDLTGAQLGLTFAAIHTTSDLLTKILHRLCAHPELFQPLREEMIAVLSKEGWKKTSLYQMRLLDSTLKETQRLDPPAHTSFARVASDPIPLPDGRTVPRGAFIRVAQDGALDPSVFPSPTTFDPTRFLRLRALPGQENNWQFVTPAPETLGFGYGMHACPGRFFASNEIKIALCALLLRYDWRLEDEAGEPQNILYGTENVVDPRVKLMYRRRQEEVDFLGLLDKE
ncbi:MAG: hypothetical protein M1821_002138 [Bathelium mastoideum]|nr:MAG: hypothetical protein M1821_002138 [Bathelium mastoideum]